MRIIEGNGTTRRINRVKKEAGVKKKPMDRMDLFVVTFLTFTVIVLSFIWYGASKGWIHTRWNYDDSEWHYQHQQERKMDLELIRLEHELYEMTKRVGVLEHFVDQVLQLNPDIEEDFDAEIHNNGSNGHDDSGRTGDNENGG